jgi:hypothetical protein
MTIIKKLKEVFYRLENSSEYKAFREYIESDKKRKQDRIQRLLKENPKKIEKYKTCSCGEKINKHKISPEGEDARIADLSLMDRIKYW